MVTHEEVISREEADRLAEKSPLATTLERAPEKAAMMLGLDSVEQCEALVLNHGTPRMVIAWALICEVARGATVHIEVRTSNTCARMTVVGK